MGNHKLSPCGTYAAAVRHKRHGEELDDACESAYRAKRTQYMKKWRKTTQSPESAEAKKLLMRARSRAMTRLTHEAPDLFQKILDDELRQLKGE
jgi:hypothetical protein